MKILVDWNLWGNPKLLRLAGLLGRSPAEAVGLLVRLWGFAAEYLPDGSFIELSDSEIAKACDWRGSPFKFASSLRKSGWLDGSQVHEWQAHQGKFIEKIHAERARKKRAYEARSLHGESAEKGAETPGEKPSPVSVSVSVPVSVAKATPEKSSPIGMLMVKLKAAAVPGREETMRGYVEAWIARSDYTRVEQIAMDPWTRGKTVIEIQDHFFNGKEEDFRRTRDAFPKL